jgi:hypothetical protein
LTSKELRGSTHRNNETHA